jgi:hypothetical protein
LISSFPTTQLALRSFAAPSQTKAQQNKEGITGNFAYFLKGVRLLSNCPLPSFPKSLLSFRSPNATQRASRSLTT